MDFPHVRTSAQVLRMHAPTAYGMHPEAARILSARGIDPEAFARRVESAQGAHIDTGKLSGFSLGQNFAGRLPAVDTFGVGGREAHVDPRVAQFLQGLGDTGYAEVRTRFHQTFGLDPGDAVVEELLTQAALDWRNYDTLHERVCPIQTETLVSGRYFLYDRAGQRQVLESRVGPSGEVREVSRRISSQTFMTELRSLQGSINRVAQAISPTLNQLSSETEFVMGMHDREMELDVATALGTSGNYPSSNVVALGSSAKWNGGASAAPVENVLAVLLSIPAEVNHCVFSDLAWSAAQLNTELQAILFGRMRSADGVLQPAEFAQFFGISNVWISKHQVEVVPGTVRRTWSETDAWFGHVNPARDMLTVARRFRTKLPGGPKGIHVRPYFDPKGPMGSDKVVVTRQDSPVYFPGADFGGLITGVRVP